MGNPYNIKELKKIANDIRKDILSIIFISQAGHPGGSLSATDLVTALYFSVLNVDPSNPKWPSRDRFILSKGHACPVWYAALAERGYFDKSKLNTLRKLDSILQGHADMNKTPGVDMTVGSLGQGVGVGIGMALASKYLNLDYYTWVLVGDGECQEGSIWEAAMAGNKWKLDNLTVIVDDNKIGNDSFTEITMPVEPLSDKWKSFGWKVFECNGHDMQDILNTLMQAKNTPNIPTAVIAQTIKGKGVSFMENNPEWHGKAPTANEFELAMDELNQIIE